MTITAEDVMTSPAVTVGREVGAAQIAAILSDKHISAVPVCAPDGTLFGVVSEDDILKPFRESIRQRRESWLGRMAEGEELSQLFLDSIRPDGRTAGEIMVTDVISAERHTTLSQLAELMVRHRIKRIPILDDGRVVGIVSRSDLVRTIARVPSMLV